MTPTAAERTKAGTPVTVYSFGTHQGRFAGPGKHEGWVKVDLGPLGEWHGHRSQVSLNA